MLGRRFSQLFFSFRSLEGISKLVVRAWLWLPALPAAVFCWTYCIWKRWKPQPQLFPELFLRLVRQDRLARLPSNKFEIQEQGKAMKVTRRIGTIASLAMLAFFAAMSSDAYGHQWTLKLNGKQTQVEAKVVDFDGQQVLLEAKNGARKAFKINELNDTDMHYLKDLLVTRQTAVQEKMSRQKLAMQETELEMQHYDLWELQLTAPNGNSITRRYLARSNMEASWYAVGEFPNARVGTARKLRRRGRDFT